MKINSIKYNILILLAISVFNFQLSAQEYPTLWNEIVDFKELDASDSISKSRILFIGSSSFKFWKDVNDYFPNHQIINRGFGGSTLVDVTRYFYDIIVPYNPDQVIIYCGENDFAFDNDLSVEEFFLRFETLYGMIRVNFPRATINYLSIKPSPSRMNILNKSIEANKMIADYLDNKSNASYIDIFYPMLDEGGNIKEEIFLDDRLHMNAKGYQIWQKVMEPYLK